MASVWFCHFRWNSILFLMLVAVTVQGFPWPLIPALVGFFIALFIQFQLKNHIGRDKGLKIQGMADLYPNSIPPRRILTERGRRLYLWLYAGFGLFAGSIVLCLIIYAK